MKASAMVRKYGKKLIGKKISTLRMGDYPGGVATVMGIKPDPKAPEIVMDVSNPDYENGDPIGIFAYEQVDFLEEVASA